MIEVLEFIFRDVQTALGVAALVILGVVIPALILSRGLAYFAPFRGLVQYRRVDFHPTFNWTEKNRPGGSDPHHFQPGPDPGAPSGDQ